MFKRIDKSETKIKLPFRKRKYRSSLFLNIAMPTAVLCIALFIMTGLNYSKSIELKKESAQLSLNHIFDKGEEKIDSISNLTNIIENSETFMAGAHEDGFNCAAFTRELKNVTNVFDYVDSIFVYNQNSGKIISETGMYEAQDFFENKFIYNNYPYKY